MDQVFLAALCFVARASTSGFPERVVVIGLGPDEVVRGIGWDPRFRIGLVVDDGCSLFSLEGLNDLGDLTSSWCVFASFEFEAVFPSGIEVDDGAFVKRPFVCPKFSEKERFPDGFNVGINAEALAIHRNVSKSGSRGRRPSGVKEGVAEILTQKAGVLFVVVEREGAESSKSLLGVDVVEFDFE